MVLVRLYENGLFGMIDNGGLESVLEVVGCNCVFVDVSLSSEILSFPSWSKSVLFSVIRLVRTTRRERLKSATLPRLKMRKLFESKKRGTLLVF